MRRNGCRCDLVISYLYCNDGLQKILAGREPRQTRERKKRRRKKWRETQRDTEKDRENKLTSTWQPPFHSSLRYDTIIKCKTFSLN